MAHTWVGTYVVWVFGGANGQWLTEWLVLGGGKDDDQDSCFFANSRTNTSKCHVETRDAFYFASQAV